MIRTGKLGHVGELMGAVGASSCRTWKAHIGAHIGTSDLDVTELRSRLTAAKFVLGPPGEQETPPEKAPA
jgi:hypothetical protein